MIEIKYFTKIEMELELDKKESIRQFYTWLRHMFKTANNWVYLKPLQDEVILIANNYDVSSFMWKFKKEFFSKYKIEEEYKDIYYAIDTSVYQFLTNSNWEKCSFIIRIDEKDQNTSAFLKIINESNGLNLKFNLKIDFEIDRPDSTLFEHHNLIREKCMLESETRAWYMIKSFSSGWKNGEIKLTFKKSGVKIEPRYVDYWKKEILKNRTSNFGKFMVGTILNTLNSTTGIELTINVNAFLGVLKIAELFDKSIRISISIDELEDTQSNVF